MKNNFIMKGISTVATVGVFLPTVAIGGDFNFSPYFGADIGIKHTGFKSGYGDKIFKSKQPVGSIFAGVEICPNLDLGLVLERTISSSKRNSSLGDGSMSLGKTLVTANPGGSMNYDNSRAKFSSIGIDLIYKFSFAEYDKFKPLIGLGIKRVKAKLTSHITDSTNANYSRDINLSNNNSKTIFKLTGGAEYMFTNHFGGRVLLSFENTSKLKPSDASGRTAKLKNSFGATLGAIVRI